MDEYISKKDILQMIESTAMWNRSFSILYEDIEDMKPADVAPVVHGRWVLDEYARYFSCSACGTQFDDETDTYCNIMNGFAPNYCEDCGAKMDGGN